jgi:hypothetical protein
LFPSALLVSRWKYVRLIYDSAREKILSRFSSDSDEDPVVNQFQESLLTLDRASKSNYMTCLGLIQTAIGFMLVIAISAFELFAASQAIGQEVTRKLSSTAALNVLPRLVISPESLEPNLNWMLATGDGAAVIKPPEASENQQRRNFTTTVQCVSRAESCAKTTRPE